MTAEQPLVRGRSAQRGAVLVEFAIIAFVMYLILAVTVDFGRLFFTAQAAQDSARASAREISVIPLPPDMTLEQAMQDPAALACVFQPEHLVIDLDTIPGGQNLMRYPGGLLPPPPGAVGSPCWGPTGLGSMYSMANHIRPFRKLMSAQAIFRREVFS